jgi:hypothetical protein
MPERKRHLSADRHSNQEDFRSRKSGRNPAIPERNRTAHGQLLHTQYAGILAQVDERARGDLEPITDEVGIYVEIVGDAGFELPLDSLDTSKDFKLRSVQTNDGRQVALVFIPEERRRTFLRKLEAYLDPEKDRREKPRNKRLINSVAAIRLASLRSFWTDSPADYPADADQAIWWEIWLKRENPEQDLLQEARSLAERIDAQMGNTALHFFDSSVVLLKASARQLESAPEIISNLEELRKARETPGALIESSPVDQRQWIEDLLARTRHDPQSTTAVVILDAGVNFDHPLLSVVSSPDQSESWNPAWPPYDLYDPTNPAAPFKQHGSLQAGLAAFGNLHDALVSTGSVPLSHRIESGRILPPRGQNDPELYGAVTVGTAAKLETERPLWNRVYSLAVTSDSSPNSGQPSSWSSEIDFYTSGLSDGKRRLFVVSAGNNPNLSPTQAVWDQVELAKIEDPAQAWNALTVGAFTEITTNDDPEFDGWVPMARAGDPAPTTSSSVHWDWRKHAPYKPDVVAEGGNFLVSPDATEAFGADVVSLLTTSGRATGALLATNRETSAACALVSRDAAVLMAAYPEYWPETIRGMLAHSADWTPRMWERFGDLHRQHSAKLAKESMLRCVGYGVPDIDRALYSARNALTLVAQAQLHPFTKAANAPASTDPKLKEMRLHKLPWPAAALRALPPELEVKLRVTLSYFIEPNPGRRGYRRRYSYQSHGLRFETIRPGQSLRNFRSFINGLATDDEYNGPEGDADGWLLGPQLRARGSLHSDTWTGPAAMLADMSTIAVYPVGGWWKYRNAANRWQNEVPYSLIVSISVPDEDIDIYTPVETIIQTPVEIQT